MKNVAIIGSGPAGYTAGIYAGRANLEPVLFEGLESGGQLMLTTDVENYPGFVDGIMGPELMQVFKGQAERFGTEIKTEIIDSIENIDGGFKLTSSKGEYEFKSVIIASGASARWLGVEGEKELQGYGVSACATCDGFFFKEKEKSRKLNITAIKEIQEIDVCDYHNLKAGKDFVLNSDHTISNSILTLDPDPSLSYAFCSDTSYKPDIIDIIKEANLLYHEATFLSDKEDLAKKTRHSTAEQAALIAKKANVKKLIIGHYSSRYSDTSLFKRS